VSTVLSTNEVVASFWSPDGRWIAALSRRTGSEEVIAARGADLADVQGRLLRLDLDLIEADSRQVVEHGPVTVSVAFASQYLPFFDQYSRSHSLWSPDSKALVLPEIGPSGAPRLVLLDTDGGRTYLVDGDMPAWNVR
jgi:Tol biopolymer transport system component